MSDKLRMRAAKALDLTHGYAFRGPQTMISRQRIAEALDMRRRVRLTDVIHLENVVAIENKKNP